jgi:hypothetical protein
MSKWPMRGHFRYLRFKTFSMTPRTSQCEVFWALLSNSEHSGVSEDSKSPTLGVGVSSSHFAQSGVATASILITLFLPSYRALARRFTPLPFVALLVNSQPVFLHFSLIYAHFLNFCPLMLNLSNFVKFFPTLNLKPPLPKLNNFCQIFPNFSNFSQLFLQFFQTYSDALPSHGVKPI